MKTKIQQATVENLKSIQDLNHMLCVKENKEFDTTINPDYPIQKQGEEYFRNRIENDYASVALVDNKVVGYLVGAISEVEDYRNISKIAEVENMFILEDYRSLGIGKKLTQKFINWCKSKNVDRVRAAASSQNQRAIEFYRREEFEDYDLVLEKKI